MTEAYFARLEERTNWQNDIRLRLATERPWSEATFYEFYGLIPENDYSEQEFLDNYHECLSRFQVTRPSASLQLEIKQEVQEAKVFLALQGIVLAQTLDDMQALSGTPRKDAFADEEEDLGGMRGLKVEHFSIFDDYPRFSRDVEGLVGTCCGNILRLLMKERRPVTDEEMGEQLQMISKSTSSM